MVWVRFYSTIRNGSLLLCGLFAVLSATVAARESAMPTRMSSTVIPHTHPTASDEERLLAIHNAERSRLGLPALVWNERLAGDAKAWATQLLAKGALEHSSIAERKGRGENLWMGTAGAWEIEGMVDMFLEEQRYFREAAFPDISLTGNWTDVGHYSQIVWRETREVGCAIDSGNGRDVLVCRYYPAGNVLGEMPY